MENFTMRGKSKGFTLLELLIAVFLGLFVYISLVQLYSATQKVLSRTHTIDNDFKINTLLYIVQKQLSACNDFSISKGTLSYTTLFGLTNPYVKVEIILRDKFIIYREINPKSGSLIYQSIIPVKAITSISYEDGFVIVKFNNEIYYIGVFQLSKPSFIF